MRRPSPVVHGDLIFLAALGELEGLKTKLYIQKALEIVGDCTYMDDCAPQGHKYSLPTPFPNTYTKAILAHTHTTHTHTTHTHHPQCSMAREATQHE